MSEKFSSPKSCLSNVLADPSMYSIYSQAMENERDILIKYVKDSDEALNAVLPTGKSEDNNRFFFGMGKDYVLEQFNRTHTAYYRIVLEYAEDKEKCSKNLTLHTVDKFEKYMKALPAAEKVQEKEFSEVWDIYSKNELGLDKLEFGKQLFIQLFDYESEK